MLAELQAERTQIEQAIMVVERLASGGGKRRGRRPRWMSDLPAKESAQTGSRVLSAATRKRMAESQKKRWAARKAAGTKAEG